MNAIIGLNHLSKTELRYCQIFFNLLSNAAKFTPKGGTIEFVSERIESSKKRTDGKVGL